MSPRCASGGVGLCSDSFLAGLPHLIFNSTYSNQNSFLPHPAHYPYANPSENSSSFCDLSVKWTSTDPIIPPWFLFPHSYFSQLYCQQVLRIYDPNFYSFRPHHRLPCFTPRLPHWLVVLPSSLTPSHSSPSLLLYWRHHFPAEDYSEVCPWPVG